MITAYFYWNGDSSSLTKKNQKRIKCLNSAINVDY